MPLYEYRCEACSTGFEAVRSVRQRDVPASCPHCGEPADKVFSGSGLNIKVEVTPDHEAPYIRPSSKPGARQVLNRAGGGRAILNRETGGYRPALTHHTRCPDEKRQRNVAVLGKFPYGLRLNCEACGYVWIHQESTAPDPLLEGYERELTPGQRYGQDMAIGGKRYDYGARGA